MMDGLESSRLPQGRPPTDRRALVAVDLGAESCRVSLLRWIEDRPHVQLVHRFQNGPVHHPDGSLRWPLEAILEGVDYGMRLCVDRAPEGVRSVAVDGWAVDYVRVDRQGRPLAAPFCYRDERTVAAERRLHQQISPADLWRITGLQQQRLNTLYQLYADRLAEAPAGERWLNLPEYMLSRWGGDSVAEFTNASHTQLLQIEDRCWSREIIAAAGLDLAQMPQLVPSGTRLGNMQGELAMLPVFRDTELIAPACHDTASAIAGIPASDTAWGYISSGTWSLVGTVLERPCISPAASQQGFTNLGAVGERALFQKNINGMWLLKQCMESWAKKGNAWDISELCAAAAKAEAPSGLLNLTDLDLQLVGDMPSQINVHRHAQGDVALDESSHAAPAVASLIFHSLASHYAATFNQIEELTGKHLPTIYVVGGGSRNGLLASLTAKATGRTVITGSPESSTIGNLAVQLASLDDVGSLTGHDFCTSVEKYARAISTCS